MKALILIFIINEVHSFVFKSKPETFNDECFFNIFTGIKGVRKFLVVTNGYNDYEMDFYSFNNTVGFIDASKDFMEYKNFNEFFGIHIIFVNAMGDLNVFQKFYGYPFFIPRGKYLIISTLPNITNDIFEILWTYYIFNVVVLHKTPSGDNLYTYFPYEDNKCGEDIKMKYLGKCQNVLSINLYPNKIPDLIPGCKIITCPIFLPPFAMDYYLDEDNSRLAGIETVIAKNLLKRLNLTEIIDPQYNGSFYGSRTADGNFTGSYYGLFNKTCDLSFSHLTANVSFNYYFDLSELVILDLFYWHVPTAKVVNQWKNLLLIFHPYLWVTIAGIFVVTTISWWLIEMNYRPGKSFTWYVLYSLCSFLSGGIKLPKTTSTRVLIIFWIFYSLLLSTIYQSQLLSILTTPIREHQVSTERELAESSFEIVVTVESIKSLQKSGIWYNKLIANKAKVLSIGEYVSRLIHYKENSALPYSKLASQYYFYDNFLYPDKRPKLYIFSKSSYWYVVKFFFRKGYPFLDKANDIVFHLIEGGFVFKWMEELGKPIPKPSYKGPEKITLEQLTGAFFLLITGMCISTLVFIGENLLKIIQDGRKRKRC